VVDTSALERQIDEMVYKLYGSYIRGDSDSGGQGMKPIRLSEHAKEQIFFRGTTEEEVIETIQTSKWQPAELGRLECKKDFLLSLSVHFHN
jgi:hypothetical protein